MAIYNQITKKEKYGMLQVLNDNEMHIEGTNAHWWNPGELALRVNYINDLIEEGIIN